MRGVAFAGRDALLPFRLVKEQKATKFFKFSFFYYYFFFAEFSFFYTARIVSFTVD